VHEALILAILAKEQHGRTQIQMELTRAITAFRSGCAVDETIPQSQKIARDSNDCEAWLDS